MSTKSFKRGTKVKAVRTRAVGTVVSTSPFAVKYTLNRKRYVRMSNPKYWKRR